MDPPVVSKMVDIHITAVNYEPPTLRPYQNESYGLSVSAPTNMSLLGLRDNAEKSCYAESASGTITWDSPFGGKFTLASTSSDLQLTISVRRRRRWRSGEVIGSCTFDFTTSRDRQDLPVSLSLTGQEGVNLAITVTVSRTNPNANIEETAAEAARRLDPRPESVIDHFSGAATVVSVVAATGDSWKVVLDRLSKLIGVMDTIAEIHPWLSLAWGVVSMVYKITAAQVALDGKIRNLIDAMADSCSFATDVELLTKYSESDKHKPIICDIMKQIVDCSFFVKAYCKDRWLVTRALKNIVFPADQEIQKYTESLKRLGDCLQRGVLTTQVHLMTRVIDNEVGVKNAVDYIAAAKSLDDLTHVGEARKDINKKCLPTTRTEVINAITAWVVEAELPESASPDWAGVQSEPNQRVLWVCGVSGAGKSSIARSVAARLEELGRLGSFYAFDRSLPNRTNPSTLFSTITRDLASRDPVWKQSLLDIIGDDTSVTEEDDASTSKQNRLSMRKSVNCLEQFQNFIVAPSAKTCSFGNTVILIDAFDECGTMERRKDLLSVLTERADEIPDGLRIIVTSRYELDVQKALGDARPETVQRLLLSDIPGDLTKRDIETFIRASLPNDLPSNQLHQLILKAELSFQWASTACRLITLSDDGDAADPEDRLRRLLESDSGLDALYLGIMDERIGNSDDETLALVTATLGIMVALAEPLPLRALSVLASQDAELSEKSLKRYQRYFRLLASVINGAHDLDTLITPLHTSFAEFLLDHSRSKRYWADPLNAHHLLARRCLRAMRNGLKFNLCGLSTSFKRNKDIVGLDLVIAERVSTVLSYACQFWSYHVTRLHTIDGMICGDILVLFRGKFLEWLEVMSLLGLPPQPVLLLLAAQQISSQDLDVLVQEAIEFTSMFAIPIAESAPHVYLSTVPFIPISAAVLLQHAPAFPGIATVTQGKLPKWPSLVRVLEGHTYRVNSVVFSPNGKYLASGSDVSNIHIWDARTGAAVCPPLRGHDRDFPVTSIAFSPDGLQLASGSRGGAICIWDMSYNPPTGMHRRCLRNNTQGDIITIAFSTDGTKLISASSHGTVCVWDVKSGYTRRTTRKRRHNAEMIAISPDGSRTASWSLGMRDDRGLSVSIYDTHTGSLIRSLVIKKSVHTLAFSPDGTQVAVNDSVYLGVWNVQTGEPTGVVLPVPSVWAIAFSPDGAYIATSGRRLTSGQHGINMGLIQMWDTVTGTEIGESLRGHNDMVSSISFSPNGTQIASGSKDSTVRIWDVREAAHWASSVRGHSAPITAIAVTRDGATIASASEDRTICVWDVATGRFISKPFTHVTHITALNFSPNGALLLSITTPNFAHRSRKSFHVWDVEDGCNVWSSPEAYDTQSATFSSDGTRLLSCVTSELGERIIHTWGANTGVEMCAQEAHELTGAREITFSPDGTLLASVSHEWGYSIDVWDAQTGARAGARLEGAADTKSIAFSPSSSHIISHSADGFIRVWDLQTRQPVGEPRACGLSPYYLAISPDGRWSVASERWSYGIDMWNTATRIKIEVPIPPWARQARGIRGVVFYTDGAYIMSGSVDGAVWINDVALPASMAGPQTSTQLTPKYEPNGPRPKFRDLQSELADRGYTAKDGWVVDNEGNLILWIPPAYREGFNKGPRALTPEPVIIDFSKFKFGAEWRQCRVLAT